MLSWDDILELVGDLPEIENGMSYGTPALKVRGKFMGASATTAPSWS
jgi:hypothetical protein